MRLPPSWPMMDLGFLVFFCTVVSFGSPKVHDMHLCVTTAIGARLRERCFWFVAVCPIFRSQQTAGEGQAIWPDKLLIEVNGIKWKRLVTRHRRYWLVSTCSTIHMDNRIEPSRTYNNCGQGVWTICCGMPLDPCTSFACTCSSGGWPPRTWSVPSDRYWYGVLSVDTTSVCFLQLAMTATPWFVCVY